jgi:hypothetical protein
MRFFRLPHRVNAVTTNQPDTVTTHSCLQCVSPAAILVRMHEVTCLPAAVDQGDAAAAVQLLQQEDAVRTAETRWDLGWNAPGVEAYGAAWNLCRCIPIAAKHEKLNEKQRQEAEQFYGDAVMKLFREAGWFSSMAF